MTTEAKVGAFVLGCFSVLAFTLIYLINAQLGRTRRSIPHVSPVRRRAGTGDVCVVRRNQCGQSNRGSTLEFRSNQD